MYTKARECEQHYVLLGEAYVLGSLYLHPAEAPFLPRGVNKHLLSHLRATAGSLVDCTTHPSLAPLPTTADDVSWLCLFFVSVQ